MSVTFIIFSMSFFLLEIVVWLSLRMSTPSHHEVYIYQDRADRGGPIIVPVMLVTIQLSNNGAKMTAKPLGMCPMTLLSATDFTMMATSL